MATFDENNSDFYDLEYYISLEYRYFSKAHGSKIRHFLKAIPEIAGQKFLDVGAGGGYFCYELQKRGGLAVGLDYSQFGVAFARSRFPGMDFRHASAYDLSQFEDSSFDAVTLLDVIEHLQQPVVALNQIKRVLKPNGLLVVTTDNHDDGWLSRVLKKFLNSTQRLSKEGRSYRLIKQVESYRRQFKNYHESHINELNFKSLVDLLSANAFIPVKHFVYPLVGVPVRDALLSLLPLKYRGDHQCVVAVNTK